MNTETIIPSKSERLTARLWKAGDKLSNVIRKSDERATKATERIQKAEASLLKAKERLAAAKANAKTVEKEGKKAIKEATMLRDTIALELDAAKAVEAEKAIGGTVTTEDGRIANLPKEAATNIKRLLSGCGNKGLFSPLDGQEAQSILVDIDGAICWGSTGVWDNMPATEEVIVPVSVGNQFVVQLKGMKTAIAFSVEVEGLRWKKG